MISTKALLVLSAKMTVAEVTVAILSMILISLLHSRQVMT